MPHHREPTEHIIGLAIEVRQHAGPGCRNRLTLPLCAANRYAPAFGSGVRPAFQPSTNRSRSRSASAPVSRQTILSSWKSSQFRPCSPRTTCNCRTTCAWGGLPVGLLPNLHAPRSKMPCAASSGDAAFFSVAHRGSRASSVIINPWPDTHSTVEWQEAGRNTPTRVVCPGSFTLTGSRTADPPENWNAEWPRTRQYKRPTALASPPEMTTFKSRADDGVLNEQPAFRHRPPWT